MGKMFEIMRMWSWTPPLSKKEMKLPCGYPLTPRKLFHEWSGNFTVENRPEFDEDARISSQDLPCKPERRDPEGTDTLEDLHFSVSPASKEHFSPISLQNSAKDRSFECLPFSATRSECRFLVSPPSHAVSYGRVCTV